MLDKARHRRQSDDEAAAPFLVSHSVPALQFTYQHQQRQQLFLVVAEYSSSAHAQVVPSSDPGLTCCNQSVHRGEPFRA